MMPEEGGGLEDGKNGSLHLVPLRGKYADCYEHAHYATM